MMEDMFECLETSLIKEINFVTNRIDKICKQWESIESGVDIKTQADLNRYTDTRDMAIRSLSVVRDIMKKDGVLGYSKYG